MHDINKKLETESFTIFEWFENNYVKANNGRLQVAYDRGSLIWDKTAIKLFSTNVNSKPSFEPHSNKLCQKVSHKLQVLARVFNYIFQWKLKNNESIHNIVVWLQPIVMNVPQQTNNKINHLLDRTLRLRLVY